MRSDLYWAVRKAREMQAMLVPVDDQAEALRLLYFRTSKELEEEAVKILRRFQLDHNLSVAQAKRILTRADPLDIGALKQALRLDPENAELLAELDSAPYVARLRRLRRVQEEIDAVIMDLADQVNAAVTDTLNEVATVSYDLALRGISEQVGVTFDPPPLDPERIAEVLNTPWSGESYSQRIWDNTEALAGLVKRELMIGVLSGKTRHQMTEAIQAETGKGARQIHRLIRTEATYVAGQMDLVAYRQAGVKEYRYVAILDRRTSAICRFLDDKVFKVDEATPGENYPPMHPWCRSTTTPKLPDGIEGLLRVRTYDENGTTGTRTLAEDNAARAERANNPAGPSEWVNDRSRQAADVEQYEKYKTVLGNTVPDSAEEFIRVKHNNELLYKGWRLDYRRQSRLATHPELRLPDVDIIADDAKFERYLFNPENEVGWAKGVAFTSRLGYSKENYREMVDEIVTRAPLNPARNKGTTQYGTKYSQEIVLYGLKGTPMSVTLAWQVDTGADYLRLVSAMPGKVKI